MLWRRGIGGRAGAGRRAVGNVVRAGEMALYGGAVPGDLLDLILIALAAAFAVAGYRQGFIVGVLSFVGSSAARRSARSSPRPLPGRWSAGRPGRRWWRSSWSSWPPWPGSSSRRWPARRFARG